ncbi:hypothetical protein A1O1_03646 [Capronia coronata CBS 617.96]|uniref:Coupling of ubiquitin conjugation to ER degradation protein 1 n=1 Tax=Capronia coronata CBS 617.96 TaxID=1182541 RepID=W9YDD7_9EURO|nr:uncharacterized protein A1O1_03646 [Capronia coronata CBS 617.96]EXJ90543.1 hypothetical protein A1O1_03646 [Capronia coronata CBS 617.96]
MSSALDEEASISIPSLAFVAVLGYFIYRYFFSSSPGSGTDGSQTFSSRSAGLRFTPAQVDQIAQMFPQLNRRDIMWDLHRNRGSVQATTERVLMGRGLDPAPPSFQPPISFMTTTTSSLPSSPLTLAASKPSPPDLITRYNLQSKVNSKGKEREEETPPPGWASSKEARQRMLQRRREEMILAARRKLEEKDAAGTPATAPPSTS